MRTSRREEAGPSCSCWRAWSSTPWRRPAHDLRAVRGGTPGDGVTWRGHELRVPPHDLHLAVNKRPGRQRTAVLIRKALATSWYPPCPRYPEGKVWAA